MTDCDGASQWGQAAHSSSSSPVGFARSSFLRFAPFVTTGRDCTRLSVSDRFAIPGKKTLELLSSADASNLWRPTCERTPEKLEMGADDKVSPESRLARPCATCASLRSAYVPYIKSTDRAKRQKILTQGSSGFSFPGATTRNLSATSAKGISANLHLARHVWPIRKGIPSHRAPQGTSPKSFTMGRARARVSKMTVQHLAFGEISPRSHIGVGTSQRNALLCRTVSQHSGSNTEPAELCAALWRVGDICAAMATDVKRPRARPAPTAGTNHLPCDESRLTSARPPWAFGL